MTYIFRRSAISDSWPIQPTENINFGPIIPTQPNQTKPAGQANPRNNSAWSISWRPPGAGPHSFKWSEWTLAVALSYMMPV